MPMSSIRAFADIYKRWRHTKGFGVHSPYAFQMLNSVVRPKHNIAYYGYHAIDIALLEKPASRQTHSLQCEAELLLRLAVFTRAHHAVVDASPNEHLNAALTAAYSHMTLATQFHDNCDLLVADCSENPRKLSIIAKALAVGAAVLVKGADLKALDEVFRNIKCGLFFEGRKWSIIVPRKEMAPCRYTVIL